MRVAIVHEEILSMFEFSVGLAADSDSGSKSRIYRMVVVRQPVLAMLVLVVLSSPVIGAYDDIRVTELEYDAWPRYCQAASFIKKPLSRNPPSYRSKREQYRADKAGIWHFCAGLVKIRRAELTSSSPKKMYKLAKTGVSGVRFSLDLVDIKTEPWAADMLVYMARGQRLMKQLDEAKKNLEIAIKYHPSYPQSYTMLARLHFDAKDYPAAIEDLSRGVAATNGKSGALQYYLGLAYVYNGDLEKAKEQERKARALNFPLKGLARKIAELDRTSVSN